MPGKQRQTLTRAQQALWDLQESLPDGPVNVAQYLDLRGPADIATIDRVGRRYFERMLVMSARFEPSADGPVLVHDPDLWMGADHLDFRDVADPERAAWDWMVADAATRPDLFTDRLVRFAYLQIADNRLFVYTRSHHTLADGVTGIAAFNTWASIYSEARAGGEPTFPPPVDLSAALTADVDYQASPRRQRDAAYWRTELAGLPAPVSLSRRSARTAAITHRMSDTIDRAPLATLREAQTLHRTSLPAIIATALAVYMGRMTAQDDVVIALPVAARTTAALRTTTLPVSNIAPIRTPVAATDSVLDVLTATQSSMIGALRHQRYRYEDMIRDQQPDASSVGLAPGVSGPVLNLMLFEPSVRFGDAVGTIQIVTTGPVDDLALTLYYRVAPDTTIDIQLDLDTNPRRYTDAETAAHHRRILRMISAVADALVTMPTRTVASLPLLTDEERHDLVSVAGPSGPPPRTLTQILADAAAAHGPSIALADDEHTWTYAELARNADRIAGHLLERGARPGAVVAVATGRGVAQTRALWAVARTGATILLLDPDLPPNRRETIVADASPVVTVTTDDVESWSAEEPSAQPISTAPHIDEVAYIVYTSGTTGTPKGVAVTHRGLAALTADLAARFDDGHDALVAQLSSPAFDATYFEHLLAVALGGRLVPAPPGTVIGTALADHLTTHAVTHAVVTPSVLATVPPHFATHSELRVLLTAGEALSTALVRQWSPGRTMVNLYGPAEATVMATAGAPLAPAEAETDPNTPADALAIGRPVTAMRAYVLDNALQPVPSGAAGELYLAGPALAQGYRGDPSLTATRFVLCPWGDGTRMYRTGDIAAWDDNGSLRYIGRTDDQVQIRGVRVEPAEIELAATGLAGVRAAAAVITDGTITLYIATAVTGGVMRSRVRRHLATRLPPAMWPSRIVTVDQLPVTGTGKVDREHLPSPTASTDEAHQPAQGRVETAVAYAIADTLGIPTPSMLADIIELGATSLNAAQIATAVSERLVTTVTVRDVLQATTPADLATAIADRDAEGGVVIARSEHPPASPQQTALVIDARTDPESTANVLRGSLEISGPGVDAQIVRAVIGDIVTRHEALRTIVRVGPAATLWQDVIDPDVALAQIITADTQPDVASVLDPTAAIPARVAVHDIDTASDDRVRIDIAIHHILIDDRSIDVLIDDLAESFTARTAGRVPTFVGRALQYADATQLLAQYDGAADLDWWTTQLAGRSERPRLPVDLSPSVTGERFAGVVSTHVGEQIVEHLGAAVYSHLHAAIATVTARYTGTDDVWIGVAHAGRDLLPARPAVGMFANPIVVRTRLSAETTMAALSEATAADLRAAQRHSATPFGEVARAVEPGRDVTEAPLTDVLVSYRETPRDALDLGGVSVTVTEEPATHARVPLQWNLDRRGDGLRVSLTYRADLFSAALAEEMVAAFLRVLEDGVTDPTRRVNELLPGIPSAARAQAPPARSLVELVSDTVRRYPDRPALVTADRSRTYDQIWHDAAELATRFTAAGAGPGRTVALILPRSELTVIAQLAVLMTGAAYVPVDTTYPQSRIETMLDDSAPQFVAAVAETAARAGDRPVLLCDSTDAGAARSVVAAEIDPESPAYVIFTSGSTGRPKGVQVSHRSVASMLDSTVAEFGWSTADVFACTHSLSFDFSIFEVFAAWRVGAAVALMDSETAADPPALARALHDHHVTVLSQTPSAFSPLAQHLVDRDAVGSLRHVVFGGEALHPERLTEFAARYPNVVLSNLYGITEGAVHVTTSTVATDDSRSIIAGHPLGDMGVFVLDRWLQPIPAGVWGELYIAGSHLAQGYRGRHGLTAECFVAAPLGLPGERMYRTGDIVRHTLDGHMEYRGRSDDQVQVRGYRVELAEVSAALRSLPGVTDAVAVLDGDRGADDQSATGASLIAYVRVTSENTVDTADLRTAVGTLLPGYAVPSTIVALTEWPLTASGKLDRARLPAAPPRVQETVVPDDVTHTVVDIVATVLGVDPATIDVDRPLADQGAHSLAYMHIAVTLAERTGRALPVAEIGAAPSIVDLARMLSAPPVASESPADVAATDDYTPSPQQQGLWILNRLDPTSTVYHLPAVIEVPGDIDPSVLAAAMNDLAARHDILRTTFDTYDGAPIARVLTADSIRAEIDAMAIPRVVTEDELDTAATIEAARPFDLTGGLGWRVTVFAVGDTNGSTRNAVVLVAHHMVSDGWSLDMVTTDFRLALAARTSGTAPQWDTAATPYRRYAERMTVVAAERATDDIDYWTTRLDGAPVHLSLPRPGIVPTDRTGPEPAQHLDAHLDAAVRTTAARVADAAGTTLFHLIHVALVQTLATFTGTDDIVIGTPTAGRDTVDDLAGVGMYVRTVLLRSRSRRNQSLRDALASSDAALAEAIQHGTLAYEGIVSALAPPRTSDTDPYLDVLLAYAQPIARSTAPDVLNTDTPVDAFAVRPIRVPHARVPMEFTVVDHGPGTGVDITLIAGQWRVDTDIARTMLAHLVEAIGALDDRALDDRALGESDLDAPLPAMVTKDLAPAIAPARLGIDPIDTILAFGRSMPDAIAIVTSAAVVTYRDLVEEVDRAATVLRGSSIGLGDRVAVVGGRSVGTVVAALAAMSAGAAYVPIDSGYPSGRVADLIAASTPAAIITIRDAIDIDIDIVGPGGGHPVAGAGHVPAATPAYVIYTSGSTGTPKGVVVTRGNLTAMLAAALPTVAPDLTDVWGWFHSPAFDFSVWEVFGALASGGRVIALSREDARDPELMLQTIERERITILSQTPTAFARLADLDVDPARFVSLRWVVFGGEALIPEALRDWHQRVPNALLLNMYGITETTVHLTHGVVHTDDRRSIVGAALPGVTVRVLDRSLRPVPLGARGEVYVAGDQVSLGYLDDPSLTATRFVASPTGPPGARMYRTGDHARALQPDQLHYLGRVDQQVQLRGFRIELGEVAAALRADDAVADVRVLVKPGVRAGDETLVAFVIGNDSADVEAAGGPDPERLRRACAARLPAHLVPSVIRAVDTWPLTLSGKLDTATLLADIVTERAGRPLTATEDVIVSTIAAVTGTDPRTLGADANFFDLGGNSLSAARLAAALGEFTPAMSVRAVFDHPTVEMLARLVDRPHAGARPQGVPPTPRARPARLALTPQQEEIWLQWRLDPDDTGYHLIAVLPLAGVDGLDRVEDVVRVITARHDALRTSYPEDADGPYQLLWDVESIAVDLAPRIVDDVADARSDLRRPFDLTSEVPWRAALYRIGESTVLGVAIHHIAFDGHSVTILERELGDLLAAGVDTPAPSAVDFASYTQWYLESLAQRREVLDAFWSATFSTAPTALRLPGVAHGAVGESSAMVSATLAPRAVAAVRAFAAAHHTTAFMVVHTALAAVLARRAAIDDIVIGTATSGRVHEALADTVGMFARTVPLRTRIDVERPFVDLVATVTAADLDSFAHADLPASAIAQHADPGGESAGTAVSEVFLADLTQESTTAARGMSALIGSRDAAHGVDAIDDDVSDGARARFGLDFAMLTDPDHNTDAQDGMRIALVHRAAMLDTVTARGLVDDVAATVTAAVSAPHLPIVDHLIGVPALESPTDQARQAPRLLAEILATAADRHADRTALSFTDDGHGVGASITYRELASWAAAVAHDLTEHGVGRGDLVAVHTTRSVWSVIGMWAVASTGAAFLHLDADDPVARRRAILADARPRLGLHSPSSPPTGLDLDWITLRHMPSDSGQFLTVPQVDTSDLAYVTYTSGSTGTPKGVMVTHGGLSDLVASVTAAVRITPDSVVLHNYAITFDAHLIELLPAFAAGARVAVCPPDVIGGDELHDLLTAAQITTFFSTPSTLATLRSDALPPLECVIVGGEQLPAALAAQWSVHRPMVNFYGPTETTVAVTGDTGVGSGPVTIGSALAGITTHVLDDRLRPVPADTIGELYISGPGVARGYVGRADLTAERFVPDPFAAASPTVESGARMYRTGDLVYRRRDGALVIRGRTDDQLKLRGIRLEPAEVESALAALPSVTAAVVGVHHGAGGADVLAAWVIATDPTSADTSAIRDEVAVLLPRRLVPGLITFVDEFPRTRGGKLDRAALPQPTPTVVTSRPPTTPNELAVAKVWADVIGTGVTGRAPGEMITADSDFFALGGTSLSATRAAARIREHTGRAITVREVFDARTVADLAAILDSMAAGTLSPPPMHLPVPADLPLSYPQRRLWILNRIDPVSTAYTVPVVLRITGGLDVDALRRAVGELPLRHDSLRTVYPETPAGPRQRVLDPAQVSATPIRHVPADGVEPVVAEIVSAPFDLTRQPGFRAELLDLGTGEWLLVIAMHHVAVDGWSMRTLLTELVAAYTDGPDRDVSTDLTYGDFTQWQTGRLGDPDDPTSEFARQLHFWTDTLSGAGEPIRLPGSSVSGAHPGRGGRVHADLDDGTVADLDALAASESASFYHVAHAVLAVLIGRWTGRHDLVIGAPVLGRNDPAWEPVVGMFVNTLALRTVLDPAESIRDTLRRVRDTDLAATAHDEVPYDAVARAVRPDHAGRADPLISVLLVQQEVQAVFGGRLDIPVEGLEVELAGHPELLVGAKFDLEVVFGRLPGEPMGVTVIHSGAIPAAVAQQFLGQYLALLRAAVDDPARPFPAGDELPVAAPRAVDPADTAGVDASVAPGDVTVVREVMAEVLGIEASDLADSDDFFGLGGTSLSATQVVSSIGRRLGTTVSVGTLFDAPSVIGFARAVAALHAPADASVPELRAVHAPRRGDRVPLTSAQRRIWFTDRLLTDRLLTDRSATGLSSTQNVVPVLVEVPPGVDDSSVRAALRAITDRHAPLRSVYPDSAQGPFARELASYTPVLTVLAPSTGTRSEHPVAAVEALLRSGFDITRTPPIRAALVTVGDSRMLLVVVHHIAMDGQSVPILTGELRAAMAGEWLAPLEVGYPQFAVWESGAADNVRAVQMQHWTRALDGYSGILDLPTDNVRRPDRSTAMALVAFDATQELSRSIAETTRAAGVTRFHALHAALAVTLAQWAGVDDVAVGAPATLRRHPETAAMVGMFVSTVVLRTPMDPDTAVLDFLHAVRDTDVAALDAATIGFDDIVGHLNPRREPGRHPLVQVMLSVIDTAGITSAAQVMTDGSVPAVAAGPDSDVDLQVTVSGVGDDLTVAFGYATDLFERSTIDALAARWRRAVIGIASAVSEPGSRVRDLDLRSREEIARQSASTAVTSVRTPITLGDILTRTVAQHPDAVAIDDGHTTLTYDDLDQWADAAAESLRAAGVRPGDVVAVRLLRSVESVVAMWAVARIGAAYAPVDPRYPPDRVRTMLATVAARVAIAEDDSAVSPSIPLVTRPTGRRTVDTPVAVPVDAPAYVVFTSGTTGTPNAVYLTHRGLSLYADPATFGLRYLDRVAHMATPSFDAALLEILLATAVGARLVIVAPDRVGGAAGTAELAQRGVTAMFITPAVLATLDAEPLAAVRRIWVGGEAVEPELVQRWNTDSRLEVVYGPTEATMLATHWAPAIGSGVRIGDTYDTLGSLVLDRHLRPVPDGIVGELYLVGPPLAQGYHDAPLTASRFLAAPGGDRMYRTGDRVRRTPTGLTFEGRTDEQRQIRGLRVEPGEVSAALAAAGAVQAVTVVAAGPAGDVLVSYVVRAETTRELRTTVAALLPAHLVPAQIIDLDHLPLTPVGKVDTAALPAPRWDDVRGGEPRNDTESSVLEAFRTVLGNPTIGVHDDYFAVGGTSLQIVQIATELRSRITTPIPAAAVFTHPTPAALAALIDSSVVETGASVEDPLATFLAPVVDLTDPSVPNDTAARPLWCVHPASGLAVDYAPLSAILGTAVFGLQLPGLADTSTPTASTIGDLAAAHVSAVRARQPHGPYRLAGWSVGGQLAHEMAIHLTRAGERVELLALLDPRLGADLGTDRSAARFAEEGARIDPATAAALAAADGERFTDYRRRVDALVAAAAAHEPDVATVDTAVYLAATDNPTPDRWRSILSGRMTVLSVSAEHAHFGDAATMATIGEMLSHTIHGESVAGPAATTDDHAPDPNRGTR